jgi:two-component system phosphate regulon sensor histidine kinase PhoR
MNRTYSFIAFSSIALCIVLVIQVNWIFQTAKIKEELFNDKANIVLSKTTAALYADEETCLKIEAYAEYNTSDIVAKLGAIEMRKIDSLFSHYMAFYNFDIDYSFVISKPTRLEVNNNAPNYFNSIYNKNLDKFKSKKPLELKLIFPDKKQFILAEMGLLFITSVLLILVVLILFWRTTLSLLKEKRISEHTADFLNNMTHEFKTPLTNIALASKLLGRDANFEKKEKLKHYTEIILAENQKLSLQVEQMLGMTALERGEIPLQKVALDFHQLTSLVSKSIRLQIEDKNGHLDLHLEAKNSIILADKIHLTNMLCSLMDNAIKYSTETIKLSIQTTNIGQNLCIKVSDQGIGIAPKYQKKVFDKFFRVPTGNVHNVKGFGLGLTYLKSIIELHEGNIELQSKKGVGTTFTITLPNYQKHV